MVRLETWKLSQLQLIEGVPQPLGTTDISDQTRKTSKLTQLQSVYTDLCKKRSVTLPSSVQSHSDAPRLVLSSNELFFNMPRSFSVVPLSSCPHWASRGKLKLFLLRMCRTGDGWKGWKGWKDQMYFTCFASLTDGRLFFCSWISCLKKEIWAKTLRETGLRFFTYFLVSSGGVKIKFCPSVLNLFASNHSIWCKFPEIISKVDAKINLLSHCTNTGLLTAWHRDMEISGMDALAKRPTTAYADSSILPVA